MTLDLFRPTFHCLSSLEYVAVPWDYFTDMVKSASMKELRSATIDFGVSGMTELTDTFTALEGSEVARKLTTLVCLKHRTYEALLNYISTYLPAIEDLTIWCEAREVFVSFYVIVSNIVFSDTTIRTNLCSLSV